MLPLLSLLVVFSVSLMIMRVGAVALELTGVTREVALFQAHSAFLGVGFTTRESEQVLRHPVRRRIVMLLMLLGNVGIVAGVSSVMLLFLASSGPAGWIPRVATLVAGIGVLWIASTSAWVDRQLSHAVEWALRRWTNLDVRDYVSLLHLGREYGVVEFEVPADSWLAGRRLEELDLRAEGALVLGIERPDGAYVGVPRGPTYIRHNDTVIVYGRSTLLEELDGRVAGSAGDVAHAAAVERHQRFLQMNGAGSAAARDEVRLMAAAESRVRGRV